MKTILITKSGDYHIELTHEREETKIVGNFKLVKDDKLNLNLTIIHKVPHTTLRTLIQATVDDQAQANINCTVVVEKVAIGTDSFLTEKVLLLSNKAKAIAVPNLEILTDDVKCSHAATIGPVNDEQLFYLQSRGINHSEAKQIIADSFLNEVK